MTLGWTYIPSKHVAPGTGWHLRPHHQTSSDYPFQNPRPYAKLPHRFRRLCVRGISKTSNNCSLNLHVRICRIQRSLTVPFIRIHAIFTASTTHCAINFAPLLIRERRASFTDRAHQWRLRQHGTRIINTPSYCTCVTAR